MHKALTIGAALFVAFVVIRAPAGLLPIFIGDSIPVTLLEPHGTLWQGRGELLFDSLPAGRLQWDLRGVTLLQGRLGYDLLLKNSELNLQGTLAAGISTVSVSVSGEIESSFVNRWLTPYDIRLGGQFRLQEAGGTIVRRQARPELQQASGSVHWTGGPVRYVLSNRVSNTTLPPLTALLGPGAAAVAFADGDQTPLLHAELKPDGFAKIGVTKQLTKLLGNPWPGGDADHAVVLEVEEQVF